jgi:putative peptide zinc metalloprotease protein
LHELGHGYCVKRNGGEVHELGIMLLVLVPMPYVDASASSAFADKKQRILVGMAGIMVELFIAALAMLVWTNAEPGLVKSIAFNTIIIAGVSTVLVNGNPLLRFDGYYVLGDFLEIPNLGQRSNQYWGWLTKRLLFGVKGHESPASDRREALWLFSYGIAALVYRLFLMVTIILFIAQKYFVVGVVLALWAVVGTLLWPNLKLFAKAFQDHDIRSGSRSPMIVVPLLAAMLVALLCVLPLPLSTSIEGVVQLPDERRVLAQESCFIEKLHRSAGEFVHRGDLLVSCRSPRLQANREILQHQRAEAVAQRQGVWDDPVQIKIYDQELGRLDQEIAENQQQLEALKFYAEADGQWWVKNAVDQPGRFVTRSMLIGHVITDRNIQVLGMIPEADIDLVRERVENVTVLKASRLDRDLRPSKWQVFPAASKQLISPVLTEDGGGTIAVNPAESPPMALQRYFLVDLEFDRLPSPRVQERILIKFEHPPEALVYRCYRLVRRTFLEYFDV